MQCLCIGFFILLSFASSHRIWQKRETTDAIHYPSHELMLEAGGVDIDTPGERHTATYTPQDTDDGEQFRIHKRRRKIGATPAGNVSVVRTELGSSYKIVNHPPDLLSLRGKRGSNADVATRSGATGNSGIVFRETSGNTFQPTVPDECMETGYCEMDSGYPATHIGQILRNASPDLVLRSIEDELYNTHIVQRFGDIDAYELCTSYEKIVYPKSAQHKDGNWFYIINESNVKQGFRVETCSAVNVSCNPLAYIRHGMEAKCKQKYILRRMQAINTTGGVFEGQFKVPSCCYCEIKDVDLNSTGKDATS